MNQMKQMNNFMNQTIEEKGKRFQMKIRINLLFILITFNMIEELQ